MTESLEDTLFSVTVQHSTTVQTRSRGNEKQSSLWRVFTISKKSHWLAHTIAHVQHVGMRSAYAFPEGKHVSAKKLRCFQECLCCYCGSELLGEILNVGEETRMFCEHKIQANLLDLVDNQCAQERTFS